MRSIGMTTGMRDVNGILTSVQACAGAEVAGVRECSWDRRTSDAGHAKGSDSSSVRRAYIQSMRFGNVTPSDDRMFAIALLQSGPSMVPDRKSTRLNSSHSGESRMPSSA